MKQENNLSEYLILEGRDHGTFSYPNQLTKKYTSKDQKITWYDLPHSRPNIRQFIDLLSDLRDTLSGKKKMYDGNGKELTLDEITNINDQTINGSEWLDARLEVKGSRIYNPNSFILVDEYTDKTVYIISNKIREPLEDCIKASHTDAECYVDLFSANNQGLPTKKSNTQDFKYINTESDRAVAGFSDKTLKLMNSGRSGFLCGIPISNYEDLARQPVREIKTYNKQ